MEFKIKWNKRALEGVINDGMEKVVDEYQVQLDRVFEAHAGDPVDIVLADLGPRLRAAGWKTSDAELRPYAEAISQRTRIKFEPGRAKL